jgi:phosphate transport system permease protein
MREGASYMDLGSAAELAERALARKATFLRSRIRHHQRMDAFFRFLSLAAALFIPFLLAAVLVVLFLGALPAIKEFGLNFLTTAEWDPVNSRFGALVPIYGTLATSAIALVIAVPVSFGIALFLTELAPRFLRTPLGMAVELLAAVPSVIYGMWGLFIFAPFCARVVEPWMVQNLGALPILGAFFQGPSTGIGILPAGFILAVMIIPFISAIMRDVFGMVPLLLKESAYGLGATTWEVVWNVVLPESRLGVFAGIILGLGRALGETMAVTFIIGNSHELSKSLLSPGTTISSALANEFTEAVGNLYTASLVELGLILFVVTFVVLALSKLMMLRVQSRMAKG